MERVGEYEVTGRLGAGAMGVVLRVRHVRLGVERALKVLAATTPDRLARFEREVRALADVRHENVVAMHEVGQHAGRPWFVMDLVAGEPLDQALRRGQLPLEAALRLASGLARGLAALHARGVVHRDLKPGNVVVRPDGSPVILDLGLALSPESDERLTRTGALVGTLGYMAPEQLLGQRATAACDLYALGAILFEALSGEPLVAAGLSFQSMIAAVVDGRSRSLAGVRPDLPEALERLVARLLAHDPAARPDAASVAAALEDPGLLAGRSAGAALRQARAVRLGLVLLALVAGAGAVVGAWVALDPGDARGVAAVPSEARSAGAASAEPTPVDLHGIEHALDRAIDTPRAAERAPALAAWLRANPAHPRREQALAAWREARRQTPLAAWPLAPDERVQARWIDERRAFVWVHGVPGASWIGDAWTGGFERQAPTRFVLEVARDPRGGVLVATDRRTLSRLAPGGAGFEDDVRAPLPRPVDGLAVGEAHLVVLQDARAHVLDRAKGRVLRTIGPIDDAPEHLALCDGERVLVVASGPAVFADDSHALTKVRGYDVSSGELLFEHTGGDRTSFVLAAPGGGFVAGTTAGVLARFDRDGEREVQLVSEDITRGFTGGFLGGVGHEACVRDGAFVEGGRRLLTLGGHHGTPPRADLRCWDAEAGGEAAPPVRWPAGARSLDVSPDERAVLVGLESGSVELWAAPHRPPELDLEPGG